MEPFLSHPAQRGDRQAAHGVGRPLEQSGRGAHRKHFGAVDGRSATSGMAGINPQLLERTRHSPPRTSSVPSRLSREAAGDAPKPVTRAEQKERGPGSPVTGSHPWIGAAGAYQKIDPRKEPSDDEAPLSPVKSDDAAKSSKHKSSSSINLMEDQTTAFSLSCFQCNTTGSNCEENDKPCDANLVCMTTLTEIRPEKTPAKSYKYLVKSCGERTQCNQTFSMSFNSSSLYSAVKCCESEKCKTQMPEVPKTPLKENTNKCPSCNEPAIKCSSPTEITCIGEENKCVSYTSKDSFSSKTMYTWKGCATETLCAMKNLTSMPSNHILASPFQCNHTPSLLPGLLPTAILGIVMLKLLS